MMRNSHSEHGFTPLRRSAEHGFTLVELMVVIFVMGLMAGAVVLSMGSTQSDAAEQADRLASRVAAARDEAVTGSAPVRVWISASGYGFERYRRRAWQPMNDRVFRATDWREGTTASTAANGPSRLAFDSIGMPDQPLTVTIAAADRNAVVRIAANGDVAVE